MQSLRACISQREINQDGFSKASEHSFLHIAEMLSRVRKVSKFASEIKNIRGESSRAGSQERVLSLGKRDESKKILLSLEGTRIRGLPGAPDPYLPSP